MQITGDPWVLEVVKGYKLELDCKPVQHRPPPPLIMSKKDTALTQTEIEKMVTKRAIVPVAPCDGQFLSQLFLIPKKDGSSRPVVNLKALNKFITRKKFKMEGAHFLRDLLRPGDWMASIDLKDAYFSVTMAQQDRKLLRFSWQGQMYEFQCLPFGLSSAPRVFTKLLKPVTALLRQRGLRLILYLDDMLLMAQSKFELKAFVKLVPQFLQLLGFNINWGKSVLPPTQRIQFLGFTVDSVEMSMWLPGQNQSGLQGHAETAFHHSARVISDDWASDSNGSGHSTSPIVLSSASAAKEQDILDISLILNKGHSGTRSSAGSAVVEGSSQRVEWEGNTSSVPRCVHGNRCLPTGMGSTMRRFAIWRPVDRQGAIHAHKLPGALGGNVRGENICQTEAEPPHSPTNGQHNCCGIYQQNGRHTLKHPIEHGVQPLAMVGITLSAEHLPGIHNTTADAESRTFHSSAEWQLLPSVFRRINTLLGPCQVDLFATRLNHQLPCYISWHPDHFAMSTDAFLGKWTCFLGYAFPPFALVVPPKSEEREKLTIGSSPIMAITSLVPSPSRVLGPKPSANTDVQQHTSGSFRSPTPNGDPRASPVSRMEGLRKNHRAAGILERSSKLILSGWSKGTSILPVRLEEMELLV